MQQRAREFVLRELETRDMLLGESARTSLLRVEMYDNSLTPREIYEKALLYRYDNYRKAHYKPRNDEYSLSIDDISNTSSTHHVSFRTLKEYYNSFALRHRWLPKASMRPDIIVEGSGNWLYRLPKTRLLGVPPRYRLSLNVLPDKHLIESLDRILVKRKTKGFYRMPKDMTSWAGRHDSITLFLQEKPSEKLLYDIINATEPYVRTKKPVLLGQELVPGIAFSKERSDRRIALLINNFRSFNDGALSECIQKRLRRTYDSYCTVSEGVVKAAEDLLDFLAKEAN